MKKIKTGDLENLLKHASKDNLEEILESYEENEFTTFLNQMLVEKHVTKTDVISKTVLHRNYAYQIFQGTRKGSKDKILQICLAMGCTLEETNRLLVLSGNPILYAKNKRDAVLIVAVECGSSVMAANELLDQYGFEAL